jgi:hypothetical protein
MNSRTKLLTFASLAFAVSSLSMGTVLAQAKLTKQSKLSLYGIGGIKVGMNVAQAGKAAGTRLVGDKPNNACYYVKPQVEPKEIGFMVTQGRISRVDVWENKNITTLKGAKLGDSETRIKSLYPGQIKVTSHKYVQGGHYLTFIPKDSADKNYRLVFETNGKVVTRFRSGKLPEVEFVEGCS